jgi:hypothetical protein
MERLNDQEIEQARDWLADCSFRDVLNEDEIYEMPKTEIERAVETHYEGGVEAFKECVSFSAE